MKLKMAEHYQDSKQTLILGDVVEVNDYLGQWLLDNGKAQRLPEPKPEPKQEPAEVVEVPETPKRRSK